MKILVFNAGSSSLKYKLFKVTDTENISIITDDIIENIKNGDYHNAILKVENSLKSINIESLSMLDGIGHRVVHGGEAFRQSEIVTQKVIQTIRSLIPLAPLHNPANLEGILIAQKHAPTLPQVAVFDTAFHQTIPEYAFMYALPYRVYKDSGVRRYGFHGTSHYYVAKKAAKMLGKELSDCNLITLHLGNGASACAIKNGKSVDTSMGFTPLEGLMMGTRCGDIDPAIILYLSRDRGYSIEEIDEILNKKSGLFGISSENDMRQIHKMISDKNPRAKLAHDMFCYRICKYIGSYMAVLGNVDAIIFTGGIGENDAITRDAITQKMSVDIPFMTIATNEELEIALQTVELLN